MVVFSEVNLSSIGVISKLLCIKWQPVVSSCLLHYLEVPLTLSLMVWRILHTSHCTLNKRFPHCGTDSKHVEQQIPNYPKAKHSTLVFIMYFLVNVCISQCTYQFQGFINYPNVNTIMRPALCFQLS